MSTQAPSIQSVDELFVWLGRGADRADSPVPESVDILAHGLQCAHELSLVAPDGSVYTLHNRTGGSADNINQTYTVNLSSEALNGTWKLRVRDAASGDTGYINSWSVTF